MPPLSPSRCCSPRCTSRKWVDPASSPWPPAAMLCREDAALAVLGLGAWLAVGARAVALGRGDGRDRSRRPDRRRALRHPWFRGEPYPHWPATRASGARSARSLLGLVLHPFRALGTVVSTDRFVYLARASRSARLPAAPGTRRPDRRSLPDARPESLRERPDPLSPPDAVPVLRPAVLDRRGNRRVRAARAAHAGAMAGRGARRGGGPEPRARLAHGQQPGTRALVAQPGAARRLRCARPGAGSAALSAQDPYVPHLSLRPHVFVFPVGIERGRSRPAQYRELSMAQPARGDHGARGRRGDHHVPGGREYRYAIAAEAGPHQLLSRERSEPSLDRLDRPGSSISRVPAGC